MVAGLTNSFDQEDLFALFGLFFFVVPGFHVFGFFKVEDHAIDAIAQAGGGRTVFKYVAEVGLAAATFHFGAAHAMGIVGQVDDAGFADRCIEAGPTAATLEFSVAFEESVSAGCTIVGAYFFRVLKGAGTRALCAFHPGDVVYFGIKGFFPFFFAQVDPGGVCTRINGVGAIFFCAVHNCFFLVVGRLGVGALLQKAGQYQDGYILNFLLHLYDL